jgi:bifunctional DNase/RNase
MPVKMDVHGLAQSADSDALLVVLKESERERYLAIGIGPLEIASIAAAMQGVQPPRPMTHDLLCSALAACDARVTQVLIHALIEGVFHARLALDVQGRHTELDSRSSDAIAVALRMGVPIHVEEAVLEQAGITPSEAGAPGASAAQERIGEEQLGAFRDVIRGLDLDDLDRPRPAG